jgi:cobalamin biosynthesis protein CobT
MNREIATLRDAVVKIVPMLAGMGLLVTQQGTSAYVSTDPKTLKPVRVNIPHIPDNASAELIHAIQGFIDHEVGHILFTDWAVVGQAHKAGPKMAALHNIVEDTYIERGMQKKFPGSVWNMHRLHDFFLAQITEPALAKCKTDVERFQVLMVPLMRALSGQQAFRDYLDRGDHWKNPFIDAVMKGLKPDTVKRLPLLANSTECFEVAKELEAIIYPPPPPAPPMPSESEASDGKGKGEKEHEEDSEEASGGEGKPEENEDDAGEAGDGDEDETEDADDEDGDAGDADDDAEEPGSEESGGSDDDPGDDADDEGAASGDDEDAEDGDDEDAAGDDGSDDDGEDGDEAGDGDDAGGEDAGDSGADDAEGEGESAGDAADGDDEGAGGAVAGDEDDEGEGGDAEMKPGATKPTSSPFGHDNIEVKDFEDGVEQMIGASADHATRNAPYRIFTRDFDVIEKREKSRDYRDEWLVELEDATRHLIGVMQKDIERMMAARSQVINVPGFRSGRLHSNGLHRLVAGDDRVFRRRHENRSKDTAVGLLVDNSGSMMSGGTGWGSRNNKMGLAMTSAYALSLTLERVGIAHEVLGFTTAHPRLGNTKPGYSPTIVEAESRRTGIRYSREEPLYIPIYKEFGERLTPPVKARFAEARSNQIFLNQNIDGESVEIAMMRLMQRRESRKVLLVLSDGNPAGAPANGRELCSHLHKVVADAGKLGVDLVGIGIMDASVKTFYPRSVVLSDLGSLPGAVMGELKRILTAA